VAALIGQSAARHSPPLNTWTVAVHAGADDEAILGTGFVVAPNRVITAAHVVKHLIGWRDGLWVSFPMTETGPQDVRIRVAQCLPEQPARAIDVALLELAEPVPESVTPARLRCPRGADLRDHRWWAFGFTPDIPQGDEARGVIRTRLAHGQVRLDTDEGRITKGFSGSALWSVQYEAVVGLIVSAGQGSVQGGRGHALTLFHVNEQVPELKLSELVDWSTEAAGETAHAAWGWSLRTDRERGRHWSPRARGVAVDSEQGYRFRGRTEALLRIKQWLDQPLPEARVLVVTGSPGVGKSAVLGRIVTTADGEIRDQLPANDTAVRARVGSVACAVHVKGKTAIDVAVEIARAASVGLPDRPEDLLPALRIRLSERKSRFNLVIDALDEAATPRDARILVDTVLLPLAQTCADVEAQVVVGTRRTDDAGDLIGAFGLAASIIDLDEPTYFAKADLVAYAMSTLQLQGAARVGNPYADDAVALPVAHRIATRAEQNFLVAGLVARTHGLYDTRAVEPARLDFTATVDDALDRYVAGLSSVDGVVARLALTVLAYAEAPGLTVPLWRAGIEALGGAVSVQAIDAFARTSAANFLIESGEGPADRSYRLFHQALNEALRRGRHDAGPADEGRLVEAWLRLGRADGWAAAPGYLRRWLPMHAAHVGRIDDLLTDDGYLLHADLRTLIAVADRARTDAGRTRARLLRLTPQAAAAAPAERAAMLSVTGVIDQLGERVVVPPTAPYEGCWANTPPRPELTVLEGHTEGVLGVCTVTIGARTLVASAGEDSTVRLWDPVTGQLERVLEGHTDRVRAVCAVPAAGRSLLASAGDDQHIAIWDLAGDQPPRWLRGHTDWVRGLCPIRVGDRTLLASASDDRTVRLWDPVEGRPATVLNGARTWVTAVCAVRQGGRALVVSAAYDGTLTLWDAATGAKAAVLEGHTAWVTAVRSMTGRGMTEIASAGYDGTVRLWNVDTAKGRAVWTGAGQPITDLCVAGTAAHEVLAWTSDDGGLWLYDPADGRPARRQPGHRGSATGVCAVSAGGRPLVASSGDDAAVRLWDATTGEPSLVLDGGRIGPVAGLCSVMVDGRNLIAATSDSGRVRLWDAATGVEAASLSRHHGEALGVCAVRVDGRPHLASVGQDGKVLIHDPGTGEARSRFARHSDRVAAVCVAPVEGRALLASVGDDTSVLIWDLDTGEVDRELNGHTAWVRAVCAVPIETGSLVVSGSHDGTARIWDPVTGECRQVLGGHHGSVNGICAVPTRKGPMLATAGADRLVRLWDPLTGRPLATLEGHRAEVTAVCPVTAGGRIALASASLDRTVRLWDPGTGAALGSIPVHHQALSCHAAFGRLFVGLDRGILALALR
jgi:WD40 repeat protein